MDFKVRFLKYEGSEFIEGKVYNVSNGVIISESGCIYDVWSRGRRGDTIEAFKSWFKNYAFAEVELVTDESIQFTKSDLKDGMIITYRNGEKRLLIGRALFEKRNDSYCIANWLSNITTDLCNKEGIESLDFVKVEYMGEVIWERETEYMTLEEAHKKAREIGGRLKHKDSPKELTFENPENLLQLICQTTNKDMFELLKVKEFEVCEVE